MQETLHDRTGRLEKVGNKTGLCAVLHDRTGRLENMDIKISILISLHDRTGRLERRSDLLLSEPSRPHRSLRKNFGRF